MIAIPRRFAMAVSRVRNFRGDAGDGAAQTFPTLPVAECFPAGGARVGEVKVFYHDRRAVLLAGVIEQPGDGRTHSPVAPGRLQPRGTHVDADRCTDGITGGIQRTAREMISIEIHTEHWSGPQFVESGHRFGGGFPGCVQIPAAPLGVVADVVAHRLSRRHSIGPFLTAVDESHRRGDHQVGAQFGGEGSGDLDAQLSVLVDADGFVPADLARLTVGGEKHSRGVPLLVPLLFGHSVASR
jgi:hypothetical protein